MSFYYSMKTLPVMLEQCAAGMTVKCDGESEWVKKEVSLWDVRTDLSALRALPSTCTFWSLKNVLQIRLFTVIIFRSLKNIDPIMLRLKLKEGMEAEILSHLSPLILSPQFNCLKNCNEKSDTPLISEIGKVGQQANYREAFQCLDNFH